MLICLSLPGQLDELAELSLQPLQLAANDRDPHQHREEHDEICRRHVVPLGRRAHGARISRSSRRLESRRFPASSIWYSAAKSASIAASETQKVKNCAPVICGPCDVKTTGGMNFCE